MRHKERARLLSPNLVLLWFGGCFFVLCFVFFNGLQFEKSRLRRWFSVSRIKRPCIFIFLLVSLIFRLVCVISEKRYVTELQKDYIIVEPIIVRILLILMRILTQCFNFGLHTWVTQLLSTYCVSGTMLNILNQ